MRRKDLYIRLYQRYTRLNNLIPDDDAYNDILNGNRLIFGIISRYHPFTDKNDWFKLTCPLFFQDADFIFNKMALKRIHDWNLKEFIIALNRGTITHYLDSIVSTKLNISAFFSYYKECLEREV